MQNELAEKIRDAFRRGKLLVQSVGPTRVVEWKPVVHVSRAEVSWESWRTIKTESTQMILTGGHRVFLHDLEKIEAEKIQPGMLLSFVENGYLKTDRVISNMSALNRQYAYDLTAEDHHNFTTNGILVSNSPDRNYHFRPPTGEGPISQQTRVFGYIWEDLELVEYLERGMDMTNLAPPLTNFTIANVPRNWHTILLNASMIQAITALTLNWIEEDFDYSIGGISLSLDKSSKYQSMLDNLQNSFEQQIERAKRTVKILKGVQQPKYGIGIRSAFGSAVGRGVLTPAKFVGL